VGAGAEKKQEASDQTAVVMTCKARIPGDGSWRRKRKIRARANFAGSPNTRAGLNFRHESDGVRRVVRGRWVSKCFSSSMDDADPSCQMRVGERSVGPCPVTEQMRHGAGQGHVRAAQAFVGVREETGADCVSDSVGVRRAEGRAG
jgi:hypothetical protein